MKEVKTHTFNGKRYDIYIGPLKGVTGDGDCPPSIHVRTDRMGPRKLLNTIIHEALHASDWNKSEKVVNRTASDVSRLLWRLGYRRIK